MTDLYVWLAAVALVAATWLAAMTMALAQLSRAAAAQQLEERGKITGAQWLSARFHTAIFAASLLRTVARLAFFVLVLAEVVELGGEPATLSWPDLLISGLIAVPVLWICTSVLSAALARYAAVGLVARGLPIVRAMTWLCFPLTKAVSFIDEAVRRLSGANLREDEEHEAELLRSIEETQREGGLDEEAASMLENVVEFTSTDVAEIMTPR
ncbi:MAG: CNNM domain-containing protein, partial [Planctomycetota bacterium]